MKSIAYGYTITSGTKPRKFITTMAKIDTSNLIMIITWVTYIASPSHKLEWASLTHDTTHIGRKIKKVPEKTYYILDTLSVEYTQQAFTRA